MSLRKRLAAEMASAAQQDGWQPPRVAKEGRFALTHCLTNASPAEDVFAAAFVNTLRAESGVCVSREAAAAYLAARVTVPAVLTPGDLGRARALALTFLASAVTS